MRRFTVFVAVVQAILFLVHGVLYETVIAFWQPLDPPGISELQLALGLLSVSFVSASFLAARYRNLLVRLFYRIAALWLGVATYCFLAACLCWIAYGGFRIMGFRPDRRLIVAVLFGLALVASIAAVVNACWVRVKRLGVQLPNLPEAWRGRVAALVTDLHLGPVRGYGFLRRIVAQLNRLGPEIVFIGGDLYDGTRADLDRLAEPWTHSSAPLGAYYVTGNHEEFSDPAKYLQAVARAGIRVLNNEKVILDGLQIIGVHYRPSIRAQRLRLILQEASVDRSRASVLLVHSPDSFAVAEQEGISLQLCGHTHGGQFFPFTRIVSRLYRQYAHGLNRFRNLLIYTSRGAGTWGPPMRLGSNPEIVLIRFE